MNTSLSSSARRTSILAAAGLGAAMAVLAGTQVHADTFSSQNLRLTIANCEVRDLAVARCDTNDPLLPACTVDFDAWCRGEGGALVELVESPAPQPYVSCVDGASSLAPCDLDFVAACESRRPGATFVSHRTSTSGGSAGECILDPGPLEAGTFCCDHWTPITNSGTGCNQSGDDDKCTKQWIVNCPGNTALDNNGNLYCT